MHIEREVCDRDGVVSVSVNIRRIKADRPWIHSKLGVNSCCECLFQEIRCQSK
jgi:hypothetical protein